MTLRRLGLQGKIVLIIAVAVISVVAVSTYIALLASGVLLIVGTTLFKKDA